MAKAVVELVLQAQGGDINAIGDLYEIYSKELFLYACAVCKNESIAEEAVQDTMVAVMKNIKSLRQPESFKGWLFKIHKSSCTRAFKSFVETTQLDENYDPGNYVDSSKNIDLSLTLQDALSILSDEERDIVMLSIVYSYKSHEITQMLELNPATVRSKLMRAQQKLKNYMTKGGTA